VGWKELKGVVQGKVRLGEAAGPYTTYRLGGPLGALVEPAGVEDLAALMAYLHGGGGRYVVLGGGSNVLFADEGFDGVGIRLGRAFQGLKVEGTRIRVKAGTNLVTVMNRARVEGLGGLEFCAGLPGQVGGAVAGNAGARREWIGPRVEGLTLVTPRGEVRRVGPEGYRCAYRTSSLKASGDIVVEAVLRADKEPPGTIERKIRDYYQARRGKQPRAERNAGSVFKNPEDGAAGRLSEEAGMKGFRVGGARVSEVHANFIVSDGGSARDVVAVMREVQRRVKGRWGILLEPEIVPMGDWPWGDVADVWWNLKGPYHFKA
jgi:UDP-N-acetylmuramate dehydrogenase